MNIKELKELKNRLNNLKRLESNYVLIGNTNIDYNIKESEIKAKCNNTKFINDIEKLFEELIYHYNKKNIKYDKINIYLVFELFYNEFDLEGEYILNNSSPLEDYAVAFISFYECTNDVNKYKEDPIQILEKYDQNHYIISLNNLKEELNNLGLNTSLIHTTEEINESLKKNKNLVSCLTIDFNKKKSKVKVYKK